MIGNKCGMTRYFLKSGYSIPVTVILIKDNIILEKKKIKNDHYNIMLSYDEKKELKCKKSELGFFKKKNSSPSKIIKTFKYDNFKFNKFIINNSNNILKINNFINSKYVNITGISKGKGFSGTVKRWNFKCQDSTHGNSLSHRKPGSIGQNQNPGRVFKGKKMAGHLGNVKVTIKKLLIVNFLLEKKILLIKGSIPGYNSSYVFLNFL